MTPEITQVTVVVVPSPQPKKFWANPGGWVAGTMTCAETIKGTASKARVDTANKIGKILLFVSVFILLLF